MRTGVTVLLLLLAPAGLSAQTQTADQTPEQVMARVGQYVASYGAKAAAVVAKETYTQHFTIGGAMERPRRLVAEFAIVRADRGWTGFRDVVEVNGEPVRDRRDRLVSLLTSQSATLSEAARIANESARYNVGPIARNFNTPTTAMFFFLPEHLSRFTFTIKGRKTISKMQTLEIAFKETHAPTFIMTRAGKDVPVEGALWVNPEDGTVIRTRIRMRNFLDAEVSPSQPAAAPVQRPIITTAPARAVSTPVPDMTVRRLESSADFDVTYARPAGMDLWLPVEMTELYEGPMMARNRPILGRATTRAEYSEFKQFATTTKIVPQ
jgi:hypothetical protein